MTAKLAHVYSKQSRHCWSVTKIVVGVVSPNLSFYSDNFESISQILNKDTSIQDEFLVIELEVYGVLCTYPYISLYLHIKLDYKL